MTQSTLIVSMTSYPARILCAKTALQSLTDQTIDREKYHIVLALAVPEFPDMEKSLPNGMADFIKENDIEIIWHPTNTRSHKKLMPALKKYPKNPILVIDDDVIREKDFVETFLRDHEKYPNDIIGGVFSHTILPSMKQVRLSGGINGANDVPELKMELVRPANGFGGVLYPPGTFTDKRFFDEDLMMKVSPTSDESWQFCFNLIEGRSFRQTSKIFNNYKNFIQGTQKMSTCLYKLNNYNEITKRLNAEFPEFKLKLSEKRFVVSMTSYGKRLKSIDRTLASIISQSLKPEKIYLCISEKDKKNLTQLTKKYIESGLIEILTADDHIRPHNKYFQVMKSRKDVPVITVDDDVEYDSKLFEHLYDSYRNNPNRISAARVHRIKYRTDGKPVEYKNWDWSTKRYSTPSMDFMATGVGGILYPPDALKISDDDMEGIEKCINADDIYLKYKENKLGLEIVPVNAKFGKEIDNDIYKKTALGNSNVTGNENDIYIEKLGITKQIKNQTDKKSNGTTSPFITSISNFKSSGRSGMSTSQSWSYRPI